MSDQDDPAFDYFVGAISPLQNSGPPVDHFKLGLYCMRQLPLRQTRVIRALVATYQDWNSAWLENSTAISETEDAGKVESMMADLKSQLEASNQSLPVPSPLQRECIEAVSNADDQSVPGIVSAMNDSIAEAGDEPIPMVEMVLELQGLSNAGFITEQPVDTVHASGARRTSGQETGYRLGLPAEDLCCAVCRPLIGKQGCDRDAILAIDELTIALGLPREWMTAFTRLVRA